MALATTQSHMHEPSLTARPLVHPDAIEPHPASRKRHHRWLTLPSSTLLVICMFLPVLRVCGQPTAMIEWPIFWTPYIVAALVFAAALVLPSRLAALALAIRIIVGITLAGFIWPFFMVSPGDYNLLVACGVVAIMLGIAAIAIPAHTPEVMVARLGIVTGLAALPWFIALAIDHDAMWGARVSVVAAAVFVASCGVWWLEARLRPIYRRST
ncbi:MAG: hypothetical protein ABI867_27935 [Kofleriaceae bacterium]